MGMLLEGQEESCQILVTREHWHGFQISFYFAIARLRDHVSVLIDAAVHTGEIMGGCLFFLAFKPVLFQLFPRRVCTDV